MAMHGILRTFLALEASIFLAAAALHSGLILSSYAHRPAMIAELVIALVLLAGLILVSVFRPRRRAIALGAQTFAFLGTLVGLGLVFAGVGPQSMLDYALLGVLAIVLLAGGLWTSRRLTGETAETLIINRRD